MIRKRYRRILLTGAAGNLGTALRPHLAKLAEHVRCTDRAGMGAVAAGEEHVVADLTDAAAIAGLCDGVEAVVHFGGSLKEDWEQVLAANVIGTRNVYDAARAAGVKRVIYASSNHAVGFHETEHVLGPSADPRPDSYYGASKVWAEALARMHWDRFGIESACLRIGSCFPEPTDLRMMSTWLSYGDLARLVRACLVAPRVGFSVVYGVSANKLAYWDNSAAAHLGYRPEDCAEPFRAALEAKLPAPDPSEPAYRFHGGAWAWLPETDR